MKGTMRSSVCKRDKGRHKTCPYNQGRDKTGSDDQGRDKRYAYNIRRALGPPLASTNSLS